VRGAFVSAALPGGAETCSNCRVQVVKKGKKPAALHVAMMGGKTAELMLPGTAELEYFIREYREYLGHRGQKPA
jgi:hypothetical protein